MAQTLQGKDQWFVVHVLSGQENKVRDNIVKRVKTEEMSDLVYEVLVPTERVSEIKKGKKSESLSFSPTLISFNLVSVVTSHRVFPSFSRSLEY